MIMQRLLDQNKLGATYLGNQMVKRDGVQESFTKETLEEYKRCMTDPVYFAIKYCKVINLDRGLVPFELYPYQKKMFSHFRDNRFSIVLACRQSGKSISVAIYILWYAIFQPDKTIAILANKGSTAREMLSRITLALENLPFFLQPGCKILNKGSIGFSNNSRIIAAATSGNSIRGLSISLLYLDEFAFVAGADAFYTSTYPVISSGKNSQVIITSTMNGVSNLFYRLWQGSLQNTNEYKNYRIDWWDVPGRDQAWRSQTIANTSELQFAQEYGNQAIGSTDTLINSDTLLSLKAEAPMEYFEGGNITIYREPLEGHQYFMMVDVCKGRGQDYSTFSIIDMTARPYEQVASYRDNMISPLILPDLLYRMGTKYNKALMLVENNDTGQVVCNALHYELEYENIFIESAAKSGGIGVTMTRRVKRIGCSNLKDLLEMRKLVVRDLNLIQELTTFESQGESFEAAAGCHDDLVMNLVLFAWFLSTPFAELGDAALKELLFSDRIRELESDFAPIGILSNDRAEPLQGYTEMMAEQNAWNAL